MNPTAQYIRPKVYNFYLRNLRLASMPKLEEVRKFVQDAVLQSVISSPTIHGLYDNDFNRDIQLEINKLADEITRWLYSQQQLALREVRISNIRDPRLPPIVMGLSTKQAKSVIEVFRYSPYQAQRLAARYRRQRANTIADTETTRWVAAGRRIVWKVAGERGYLPVWARVVWQNSRWDRVCSRCRIMNGQPATSDGAFITPEGFLIYSPPLHPHCRCDVILEGGE